MKRSTTSLIVTGCGSAAAGAVCAGCEASGAEGAAAAAGTVADCALPCEPGCCAPAVKEISKAAVNIHFQVCITLSLFLSQSLLETRTNFQHLKLKLPTAGPSWPIPANLAPT